MESSRTHFEVVGLGLEASSSRKLPCPWLEHNTIFELLKFCRWPEKNFWRPFFVNNCACVLVPWPRAFLFLVSRGSVLRRAVLGLGVGFFLFHWPGPRALCPRLHLRFLFFPVYCCYICSLNFSQKHFIFYSDAFYKSGYDIFFFFCYSSEKQKRHSVYTVVVLQWWILHLLLNELNYVIYFSFFHFNY